MDGSEVTDLVGDSSSKPFGLKLVLGIGFSGIGLVPAARRAYF